MTDTDAAPTVAPDGAGATTALDTLRAEREFLLRSLADLEAEHAAGELTDERFRALHDQYTVQAATVLRAIERLHQAPAEPAGTAPARHRGRRAVTAVLVAAVVVGGGGTLLARSLGEREAGQTITGNAQSQSDTLDTLARRARQRPDDFDAQMAYASALMQAGEAVDALRAFDTAARLDPSAPAPKAYGGWLVFLAGLTEEALPRIDAAIAADPDYPDAHFFRGMVLLRGRNDRDGALVELRRFLDLAPTGTERDQVQQLVASLEQPSTSTTTTGG